MNPANCFTHNPQGYFNGNVAFIQVHQPLKYE